MMPSYDDWPAPIPLGAFERKAFPEKVFPEAIENFVSELSRSTETPRDLAGLTVLAALATVSHGKYVMQVKSDYCEPVNIWTAVALPPGCRKSAVLSCILKPIVKFEREKQLEIEPRVNEIVSKNKSVEVRIKEMRVKAAKVNANDFELLQREIYELEQSIEVQPEIPQFWTTDITPENLGRSMVANKECMAILSDEAGIFDILSGRYSSGIPNLDLFLKGHAGASARINRIGRLPDLLKRAVLTIGLTPQPDVLRDIGRNKVFRGRGLLARFLYSVPHSNLGNRELDVAPLQEVAEQEYHEVIGAILSHETDRNGLCCLRLSKEAYAKWLDYSRVIEIRMGGDGGFASMTDWAGKLPGQIARIAALLHIARYAKERPWEIMISEEDMWAAIRVGGYLSDHAIAAFDLMAGDPALDGSRRILQWLKECELRTFTFRDCHYAHKSRFKKATDMEAPIKILEENYYIRECEQEKRPYRPSRVFIVNPYVYKKEH